MVTRKYNPNKHRRSRGFVAVHRNAVHRRSANQLAESDVDSESIEIESPDEEDSKRAAAQAQPFLEQLNQQQQTPSERQFNLAQQQLKLVQKELNLAQQQLKALQRQLNLTQQQLKLVQKQFNLSKQQDVGMQFDFHDEEIMPNYQFDRSDFHDEGIASNYQFERSDFHDEGIVPDYQFDRSDFHDEARYTPDTEPEAHKQMAESMFNSRTGLEEAIRQDISPSVVSILTENGEVGTGFFQFPTWLISNAHVLPDFTCLRDATLINSQVIGTPISVKRSFHRNHKNVQSPDIVIAEIQSEANENSKGLQINFSGDTAHSNSLFFYVYFDFYTKTNIVKYLVPHDVKTLPLLYRCEDGTDPEPGCSGSPVIEARVTIGNQPKWEFKTIGMVYARCPDPSPNENQKLVCIISVREDLEQIRTQILLHEGHSVRDKQMAYSHQALGQHGEAKKSNTRAQKSALKATQKFQAFQEGTTTLEILLPPGLQKLIGKQGMIIGLEQSMLLAKNQAKYPKERRFTHTAIDVKELDEDRKKLLAEVAATPDIVLKVDNGFFSSTLFRIDVSGGSNNHWKIDLQDNTGIFKFPLTDAHHKELYSNGKKEKPAKNPEPASSVFAIVTVPNNIKSVSGQNLFKSLEHSLQQKKSIEYNDVPLQPSKLLTSKQQKALDHQNKELKDLKENEEKVAQEAQLQQPTNNFIGQSPTNAVPLAATTSLPLPYTPSYTASCSSTSPVTTNATASTMSVDTNALANPHTVSAYASSDTASCSSTPRSTTSTTTAW